MLNDRLYNASAYNSWSTPRKVMHAGLSCEVAITRTATAVVELEIGFSATHQAMLRGVIKVRQQLSAPINFTIDVLEQGQTAPHRATVGLFSVTMNSAAILETGLRYENTTNTSFDFLVTHHISVPTQLSVGLLSNNQSAPTRYESSVGHSIRAPFRALITLEQAYTVVIADKHRIPQAVLPSVRWHYNRRLNEATEVNVYIPRDTIDAHVSEDHAIYGFFASTVADNKARYAEIAAYIKVYRGRELRVTGKITKRTVGNQQVTIHAYTEEILLETSLTPAQYGRVWDGWDLADVARDLLDGWQSLRVKAQSQWQDRMVASSNIDLTTDPGLVMLAKRSDGRYYDSGYITLVFNKSEIPNFKAWDRVRWSADSEDPVKTSIQISTNGVSFSAPFDGGLPEEIGYYIGGDHDQVWVRINLSTTDTESEDANGVPTGVTPTVFAVELIARTEGNLAVGNIPAVAGATVKGLSADHASAFRVLVDACEQVGWEFQVVNGALNIAEVLGVDRTRDFVFRAGSNIEITALGDDDGELCNVLTAYSPGRGINRMEITLRDEASIAEYGEYPAAVEFDAEKLDELEQKAQEFLSEHNSPKTQFEIAVAFEHGKEPEYGLGDKVRVADPDTGIVTKTRIMGETREFTDKGLSIHLDLGRPALNLQRVLDGDKVLRRPQGPEPPSSVWAHGVIDGILVGCNRPYWDGWSYTECHVSKEPMFTPSPSTLAEAGRKNRFEITGLEGDRHYACLINVDAHNNRSLPSRIVSAVPVSLENIVLREQLHTVADNFTNTEINTTLWLPATREHGNIKHSNVDPIVILSAGAPSETYSQAALFSRQSVETEQGAWEMVWRAKCNVIPDFFRSGTTLPPGYIAINLPIAEIRNGTNPGTIQFWTAKGGVLEYEVTDNIAHDITVWTTYRILATPQTTRLYINGTEVATHSVSPKLLSGICFLIRNNGSLETQEISIDYAILRYIQRL